MQKISTLIQKLQQQEAAQVDTQFLLHTAEMLVAELSNQQQNQQVKKRIAVLMPQHFVATAQDIIEEVDEVNTVEIPSTPIKEIEFIALPKDEISQEMTTKEEDFLSTLIKPILQKPTSIFNVPEINSKATLNGDKMLFELNDVLVEDEAEINDVHTLQQVEVAATIKQPAVKDLRKAIGINDKYAFIQYLFKGDEATYDRCIKTINGFNVLPEADTWVKRELITKMGWVEEEETVQTFLDLVKRRFS